MLLSMTGYGSGQVDTDEINVVVEVRTVNNRYLKLHSRLPDGYAALEPLIEEEVRKQIRRGAVQLNVDLRRTTASVDYKLNVDLITSYAEQAKRAIKKIRERRAPKIDVEEQLSINALLALPGVVLDDRQKSNLADEAWPHVRKALKLALDDLRTMRKTEGQAMEKDLGDQLADIARCADEVKGLAPLVVEAYQTRLTDRLNKLLAEHEVQVQPADIVREVGVYAEKADISEEIVRLESHLDQFREIMKQPDGAGRKLEFLVQELLRETNTIGSKANNAEIAKSVVHVKTCIERIREMVQNVE